VKQYKGALFGDQGVKRKIQEAARPPFSFPELTLSTHTYLPPVRSGSDPVDAISSKWNSKVDGSPVAGVPSRFSVWKYGPWTTGTPLVRSGRFAIL
jgi:hypothetical protein